MLSRLGQIVLALIAITMVFFAPTLRAADVMEFQTLNGDGISTSGANEANILQVSAEPGNGVFTIEMVIAPASSELGLFSDMTAMQNGILKAVLSVSPTNGEETGNAPVLIAKAAPWLIPRPNEGSRETTNISSIG